MAESLDRKGNAAPRADQSAPLLRPDEQTIIDALRKVEEQQHAGIVVAFYNGSHWMLYTPGRPRWLDKE